MVALWLPWFLAVAVIVAFTIRLDVHTINIFKSKKASRFSTLLYFPTLVIVSFIKRMNMNPADTRLAT